MSFWNKVKGQAEVIKDQATELNEKRLENKAMKDEQRANELEINPKKYFKATSKVGDYLEVDSNLKLFKVNATREGKKLKGNLATKALAVSTMGGSVAAQKLMNSESKNIFRYNELVEFELLIDDLVESKGGLGRALVGGDLVVGAGAVVGAVNGKKIKKYCESMNIRITVNDIGNPIDIKRMIKKPIKTNSKEYSKNYDIAHKIISSLNVIAKQSQ